MMATKSDVVPQFPPLVYLEKLATPLPHTRFRGFRPNSQPQYDYITATEPNVWFWGNRGGGKSVTARWTCHARALTYPGYRYAILRTSFPELEKNHLIYLGAEMEALGGEYNASKYIAKYPNGSLGFYMQVETDEQARNALGVEMMEVVFDEAPTFNWDHMMMIGSSVRVAKDSGLTPLKRYNGNPIGQSIDNIFKYFIDKDVDLDEDPEYVPDEWRSIKISMQDNVDLDVVSYKKGLGVGLSLALRKAWFDGERYDDKALFEVNPKISVSMLTEHCGKKRDEPLAESRLDQPYHIVEELPKAMDSNGEPIDILELPWVKIQGSYDDGWVDPAVMLWYANIGKQVLVFNERVWTRTHSPDIAKDILESSVILRPDGTPYQLPLSTIYADPVIAKETTAVQSTMDVMSSVWRCMKHGMVEKKCCGEARGLVFEPSTNSRELFSSAINRLLQAEIAPGVPKVQFLKVDPKTEAGRELAMRGIIGCPYLLKYLPKMQFDENDPRKMADHKHDHPVVSFAYKAMSQQIATTAPSAAAIRPAWWNEFFIGNTGIPRPQGRSRRKR